MRALAPLALTGCTQIFGLSDPVSRAPADAAGIDTRTADAAPDAPPPASCDPSETALIACFDFDGSVEDTSSVGHVVTSVTNVDFTGVNGPAGPYVQVGVSSSITIAGSTAFNTPAYTIASWVRFDALPTGSGARAGVFDAEARYGLFVNPTGSIVVRGVASPSGTVTGGTWMHLAVTDTGSSITFYVNGTSLGASPVNTPVPTSNAGAEIGGNAPSGDRMEGAVDSLHVYSRILTAAEIGELASF